MELSAESERVIQGMEWEEMVSILKDAINDILAETANTPPLPPPPQEGFLQPDQMYSQEEFYSPGQYPYVPEVRLPEGPGQILLDAHEPNEGMFQHNVPAQLFAPPALAAPTLNTSNSNKKRKLDQQQGEDGSYVKKPPNAFMIFMKEQRANGHPEIHRRGCAAVNEVLGDRWRSMSEEQQAKYFEQAGEERLLCVKQHPEWSSRDHYGRKKRKQSRKAPTRAAAVIKASTSQTAVTEPRYPQTVQLPYTQTVVKVCEVCRQPWVANIKTASSTSSEPLYRTLQSQLPFKPHLDMGSVDLSQS